MKKNILAALVSLSCALGSTVANAEDLLQVFEIATANDPTAVSYTHLTLPTTPYV